MIRMCVFLRLWIVRTMPPHDGTCRYNAPLPYATIRAEKVPDALEMIEEKAQQDPVHRCYLSCWLLRSVILGGLQFHRKPTHPLISRPESSVARIHRISAQWKLTHSLPVCNLSSRRLFVRGISYETTKEALEAFFQRYGAVEDCTVVHDR